MTSFVSGMRIFLNPDTHEIRLLPEDDDSTAEEVFSDQVEYMQTEEELEREGRAEGDEGEGCDDGSNDDDDEGIPESPAFRLLTRLIGARTLYVAVCVFEGMCVRERSREVKR